MILIHVPNSSDRWSYTLDFIFGLRGIEFKLTDSQKVFEESTENKMSFQNLELGTILFETAITKRSISKGVWRGIECLSFDELADPISSIFYVLTRMEEYNCSKWDTHNRFDAKSSLQYEYGWLEKCICDRWAEEILDEIEKEINLSFPRIAEESRMIPTFDIDNTYAYKLKSGKRKMLSITKDLLFLNIRRLKERRAVLSGQINDPYDTYDAIEQISNDFPVRLFWLIGDYGSYDKNISIKVGKHKELIRRLNEKAEIGIHPSYTSNSIPDLLKSEKKKLEKAIDKEVNISRQHFLKLKFPQTYQNLIKHEIKEDFTMGFADAVGFRNGTARAFPWFDLSSNAKTELVIRPFAYMDGTLNEYLTLTPEEAKEKIKTLYQELVKSGGDFIFLWHNETIGEYGKWKGWRSVLDYTLSLNSK
tara:strand:+ start:10259 stop:11518 length:1260 start_codon:yes stop_codon:yes gene_type:complete